MTNTEQSLASLLTEYRARELQGSFRAFAEAAWPVLEPATEFVAGRHVDIICEYLSAVTTGQIKKLIINVPPRMTKSTLTTILWPCWTWATDAASSRWMCTSYSGSLSTKHSVDRRTLLTSNWYQRLWPKVQLSQDNNEKAQFSSTNRGHQFALSVGGNTTGKGGGYLVIDDPHSVEQALSDTERASGVRYIRQTLMTRLDDPRTGRIVLIMQRLHESDATGELLSDGGWEHLCLPAIAETRQVITLPISKREIVREVGDLLEPQRLSLEILANLKKGMGSFAFAGQMQQTPAPTEGGLFKRTWWKQYTVAPPSISLIIQSWDCTFKDKPDADFVVGQVWGFDGQLAYLLDQVRQRMSYTDTKEAMRQMQARWPRTSAVLVEDKANGSAILDEMRREISGLIAIEPQGGKLARAWACTAQVEAGQVFVPEFAPWAEDFLLECSVFPAGAHDDAVDAMTQALNWSRLHNFGIFAGFSNELIYDQAAMPIGYGNNGSYQERYISVAYGNGALPMCWLEIGDFGSHVVVLREFFADGAHTPMPQGDGAAAALLERWMAGEDPVTKETVVRSSPKDATIILAGEWQSFASELTNLGFYVCPARTEELAGIRMVQALFERKMVRINSKCVRLLGELRSYAWDRSKAARGIEEAISTNQSQSVIALINYAQTSLGYWRILGDAA